MARKTATTVEEKPVATKAAAPESKGTAWLTDVVNKNTGSDYSPYQIRILIRKLVKSGDIDRGEGRYEFTGLKDPRVVAIVKAAKAGGVKEATSEKVEGAKTASRRRKAATEEEPAAEAKPARRSRKAKPEPEPVEEDDDDLELDEL